jgi:hypothetical protein
MICYKFLNHHILEVWGFKQCYVLKETFVTFFHKKSFTCQQNTINKEDNIISKKSVLDSKKKGI